VISHAGITARHINSYHHSASLLFQFILAEFTESFGEIKRLDTLCNGINTLEPGHCAKENLQAIRTCLTNLVGSPRDYMRLFSWNFSEGQLSKLKAYCALFLQNTENDGKELIALQHYADKVWQACMQSIDLLSDNPLEREPFLAAVEKASASMQRMAKLVARLIHQFAEDENVIFYVVKHHKVFDRLYGGRFVSKLLGRIYPKGVREAQKLLTKKYSARGFDNIVTAIQSHISEIEAGAL
jgi:hypothetical protein